MYLQHTKLYSFQNLSVKFVPDSVFYTFCKFKPLYSYKTYSYNKGKSIYDRTSSTYLLTKV